MERLSPRPKRVSEFKSEREFTRWVTKKADEYGWRVAHFGNTVRVVRRSKPQAGDVAVAKDAIVIPDKGAAGFPDLVLTRERTIFSELKLAPNKPTANQIAWLEALRAAGEEAYVWNDLELGTIEQTLRMNLTPLKRARLLLASNGDLATVLDAARMQP